jgi:hypothetical protein
MARARTRAIDGPAAEYSTTAQAAAWLGWPVATYRRVCADESGWLRPAACRTERGGDLWHWLDLVYLAHLYRTRAAPPRPSRQGNH